MKPLILTALLAAVLPVSIANATQSAVGAPRQQPVMPLQNAQVYICNDGQQITLDHDQAAGILRVVRNGQVAALQEQVGRTPQLFVDGLDTLAKDGDKVFLVRGSQVRVECDRVPDTIEPGVVWGTLNIPEGERLPSGTKAKILLVDAGRADAPAVELGSMQLSTSDNQPPLHFMVRYDVERTQAPASPALQARIETKRGRLLYITDTVNQIPNDGSAPTAAKLDLVDAKSKR